MKKFILIAISAVLLVSCSKQNDLGQPRTSEGGLSYVVNGHTYTGSAGVMQKIKTGNHYGYSYVNATSVNNAVYFSIPCDSLAVGTYTCRFNGSTGSASVTYEGRAYVGILDGHFLTVTVTNYTAARVSGTFSGNLQDPSGNMITVTGGTFNNVRVLY